MASSQSFSMIQRRISDSPDPAAPVNSGEPLKTIASREPPCSAWSHLRDHVLEEQQRAVVDAGQAGAEAAVEAERLGLVLHRRSRRSSTPRRTAGWRGGSRRCAPRTRRPRSCCPRRCSSSDWPLSIMSERQMANDSSLSSWPNTSRWAFGFIDVRCSAATASMPPVPHAGSSSVFTTPFVAEQRVVLGEQEVHHQADDLARREVLAGGLVRLLREAPDQLLVDVAHLRVADDVGVQVDVGEAGDDEVQETGLVESLDLLLESELVDDLPCRRREAADVLAEVGRDVVGVGRELARSRSARGCRTRGRTRRRVRRPGCRSARRAPRPGRGRRASCPRARSRGGGSRPGAGSPARTRTACRYPGAGRQPTR